MDIPRDRITVLCGPSGSGKSSLAMDTIYAEGQRRYVESLSAYARQFIGQMQKPKLDHIEGLSPAIAIEQKHSGQSPRSTVGTVTEIYDYLRILLARLGQPHCPGCDVPVGQQSADEVIEKIMAHPAGTMLHLMAPLEIHVGERYETLWEHARAAGYVRIRVDGQTYSVEQPPEIDRRRKHLVEAVIDRVTVRPDARGRIAGSIENALALGRGVLAVAYPRDDLPEPAWNTRVYSQHLACERCGRSFEPLSPHHFSFNSPLGWCPACEGLGVQTGTNPAALVRDPKLTLAEGAVELWPAAEAPMFRAMLASLARATGLPLDVPFEQLGGKHRRLVMHGTGEQWFAAAASAADSGFRFQYKGLYPALDEASRVSPGFRARLEHLVDEVECSVCNGSRLRDDAASVRLRGRTMDELCRLPLGKLAAEFAAWKPNAAERKIAGELLREIVNRLQFLVDVGLEYLTLARPAPTLSGGEMQRIRLAAQVGSGLCGVLYVLDEPTIGLHPRDNRRLLDALRKLRDLGNTLLVVEHDREVASAADQLLDFGPGAGRFGGQIVAQGTPAQLPARRGSVTGPYLSGKKAIPVPTNRRIQSHGPLSLRERVRVRGSGTRAAIPKAASKKGSPHPNPLPKGEGDYGARAVRGPRGERDRDAQVSRVPEAPGGGWLEIRGARQNNLKNLNVSIPLGAFTAVTGVSGSGKSSLVEDVLYNALARTLHRAKTTPGAHDAIRGVDLVNKVIRVDQQSLGQTPTSNPATFTGAFDLIRALFAQLPEAKLRGYTPRRFSFNVPGGRCEQCEGNGQRRIEMHFLPDVWVECEACRGRRYNEETLAVQFHGRSIADVLDMSCGEAVRLFEHIPKIRRVLDTLCDVGLDYLTLGQSAPTLSGGEAQRVKLAAELSRPDTGRTLYILDEPTTGLHFTDLEKLLEVLNRLVDLGNTVVVVEHNLDVVKTADWVIDLGPEAGQEGGCVVAAGTPEDIVAQAERWKEASGEGNSAGEMDSETVPLSRRERVGVRGTRPQPRPRNGNPDPASPHPNPLPEGEGNLMRSYTGEMLAAVLAAGPLVKRAVYDFAAAAAVREGDREIIDVGGAAKMPWEINGRRWHTRERVGRAGDPCRWDGRILDDVVDRIQQSSDLFSETDWNSRSVVEISAAKKSEGWFFHAITGEEWLLKMKFRTARNVFQRDELIARLNLRPLNDMPELPLYGTQPRTRVRNMRGPWQEIELRVHGYEEIDRPEFWKFIDEAVAGFARFSQRVEQGANILQPWKQLGRKWHFARRGFPAGKRVEWEGEVLEELIELLAAAAPHGQFLWNNKQVVPLYVPEQKEPWAAVQTKKLDGVHVTLFGPKGGVTQGRIAGLGCDAQWDGQRPGCDALRMKFAAVEDVRRDEMAAFFKEHLATLKKR